MKFNVLTNSRPTSDLGTHLIVSCSSGNIKVTPDFAKAIGVAPESRMIIAEDMDNPGDFYAYADNSDKKVGGLLAKSGSYFAMSSQNAWNLLGGDEEVNKFFNIDGEVQDVEGTKVAKLVHDRDEQKTERQTSDSTAKATKAEPKEGASNETVQAPQESAQDEFEQI